MSLTGMLVTSANFVSNLPHEMILLEETGMSQSALRLEPLGPGHSLTGPGSKITHQTQISN